MFTAPVDGANEHVFFHMLGNCSAISQRNVGNTAAEPLCPMPKSDKPVVRLANKQLGVVAEVSYDRNRLPVLAEWRCLRSGDYALGIEPSTSFIGGRAHELDNGYDVVVPGFGALEFGFRVKIIPFI